MLEEKLLENAKSDIYPFHMPGHKRRLSADDACQIDITEIEGFDNLHHSQVRRAVKPKTSLRKPRKRQPDSMAQKRPITW